MAKSRDPARDPPVESEEESGEEEGSSSEEEIEGSESESEPEQPQTQNSQINKKPRSASVSKVHKPQPSKTGSADADSSTDDEESDSYTDSGSPIVTPITSKPMDDVLGTPNTKNPRSRLNASRPTSPPKTGPVVGAKRPLAAAGTAVAEAKEAKRSKRKLETGVESSEEKGVTTDDSKKLFQRLWSEDDEIVILQGIIDYRMKNKADPLADLNSFLEFIKDSIHIDVSKTQLQDKIRRLKKKYENNLGKEKRGNEKVSLKQHEQIAYELSKKIWGKESNGVDNINGSHKANRTALKRSRTKNAVAPSPKVDELEETDELEEADKLEEAAVGDNSLGGEKGIETLMAVYISPEDSGIESWIAKNGMAMVKREKREELEEKWKKLRVKEIEHYAKKLEFMLEQSKIVLETIKSGH